MDNRTLQSAFVENRLQMLYAILPQITICIENAQLVKKLTEASAEVNQHAHIIHTHTHTLTNAHTRTLLRMQIANGGFICTYANTTR